ncbi:hypothetical protein Y032_0105g3659 [Ancylostoma ceylanicum]|uniref:Uncharacterized protein n=1 Tax=Ancylostoma ceylanicum TaxID=53326 RepID=A0A016TFB1_9BILA|nr:hypothetical protein Y032_0105g3659 [Ancylostoma ceylanicum]
MEASLCYAAKLSGRLSLYKLPCDATRVERRLRPNTPSAGAGSYPPCLQDRLHIQVQKKKEAYNMKLEIDNWR